MKKESSVLMMVCLMACYLHTSAQELATLSKVTELQSRLTDKVARRVALLSDQLNRQTKTTSKNPATGSPVTKKAAPARFLCRQPIVQSVYCNQLSGLDNQCK